MNSDEVYEIKKTWDKPMENPTDSGVAILLKFFTKYPSNLEKFPTFKELSIEELNENVRFRAHANRIIRVFDESIQSLGYDWAGPKLDEIWSKIATTHFNRQIEKKAFEELKEAILEVLTVACNLNEKQIAIWVKLMDAVYGIIFRTLDQLEESKNQ